MGECDRARPRVDRRRIFDRERAGRLLDLAVGADQRKRAAGQAGCHVASKGDAVPAHKRDCPGRGRQVSRCRERPTIALKTDVSRARADWTCRQREHATRNRGEACVHVERRPRQNEVTHIPDGNGTSRGFECHRSSEIVGGTGQRDHARSSIDRRSARQDFPRRLIDAYPYQRQS